MIKDEHQQKIKIGEKLILDMLTVDGIFISIHLSIKIQIFCVLKKLAWGDSRRWWFERHGNPKSSEEAFDVNSQLAPSWI